MHVIFSLYLMESNQLLSEASRPTQMGWSGGGAATPQWNNKFGLCFCYWSSAEAAEYKIERAAQDSDSISKYWHSNKEQINQSLFLGMLHPPRPPQ